MKRVRVLKEIPFAKVGEELELQHDGSFCLQGSCQCSYPVFYRDNLTLMIEDGWLEWVEEEKSLEDKFMEAGVNCYNYDPVKIAKDHYLEVFDKVAKPGSPIEISHEGLRQFYESIRKALEDA